MCLLDLSSLVITLTVFALTTGMLGIITMSPGADLAWVTLSDVTRWG